MQDFEKHKKNFFDFIDRIDKNEKVGIISHANCVDGMVSVVFMVEILKKKFPGMPAPFLGFIPYKIGILDEYDIIFNKKGIKKVFILDANVDMNQLEETEKFFDKFEVMFVDHHPLNPNLKMDNNIIKTPSVDCTSMVLYRLGNEFLKDKELIKLACIASISEFSFKDQDNLKFIQKHYSFNPENYKDYEIFKNVLKYNSLVTYYANDSNRAYEIILKKNYEEIERVNKEIDNEFERCIKDFEICAEKYFDNYLYFYYFKSNFSIGSRLGTTLSVKYKGSTIIMLSDISGTNLFKVSARNNSDKLIYPLNDMLRAGIVGLENAIGGGHANASGGSFMKKDLEVFKKQVIEFVKSKIEQ